MNKKDLLKTNSYIAALMMEKYIRGFIMMPISKKLAGKKRTDNGNDKTQS